MNFLTHKTKKRGRLFDSISILFEYENFLDKEEKFTF